MEADSGHFIDFKIGDKIDCDHEPFEPDPCGAS